MKEGQNIVFVNEDLRSGFTQIPNRIIDNPNISLGGKCVYIKLLSYAWDKKKCFPGQETMAKDLGTSIKTIQRKLEELKEMRLITWQQRGLNKTNIYFIL